MTILPILTQALSDLTVVSNTIDTRIDLFTNFDDPSTTGLIARFSLYNTNLGGGITEVLLFDQPGVGAPITVQNFIGYVERNDYLDSVIHRSVPGFIIQGGGFAIDGIDTATVNGLLETVTVITGPAIQNEFSLDRSNLRGTIAMAKIGGDPDSATSQWFFNLADNSANLDSQNGGFTVFGQTLSEADLAPLDAIAALPRFNATQVFGQSAFGTMPLNLDLAVSNELTSDNQLVRYEDIIVFSRPELTFTILNNSNPTLVNASIEEGELILDSSDNQVGTAEITIQATTLLGESTQDTFVVTIEDTVAPLITPSQTLSYVENQTSGFSIGTIIASDAIGVTGFSIVSGNENGFFAIDPAGNLILTEAGVTAAANDFEIVPNTFTLGITATDAAGNTSTTTDVIVNVSNVNELTPIVATIAATDTTTEEGLGVGEFAITLSAPATEDITVSYTIGGTATSGTDYTVLPAAVTILAGQTTATIALNLVDDDLTEDAETVIVRLTGGTAYDLGVITRATVTIADNDISDNTTSVRLGTPQNDSLDATTGQYTVIPYEGDDTIVVNTASDVILELPNQGTDTIVSSVNYNLAAQTHIENLTLTGTDDITGIGNRKNNVITGNSGQNVLVGLQGDDTFVFNFGDSTIAKPDRIRDFGVGADRIQVGNQLLPTDLPRTTYSNVTTLDQVVNSVFTDANGSLSGSQPLEINSAALGTYTSLGVTNTYLIVNDEIPGFNQETDLVINIARTSDQFIVSL